MPGVRSPIHGCPPGGAVGDALAALIHDHPTGRLAALELRPVIETVADDLRRTFHRPAPAGPGGPAREGCGHGADAAPRYTRDTTPDGRAPGERTCTASERERDPGAGARHAARTWPHTLPPRGTTTEVTVRLDELKPGLRIEGLVPGTPVTPILVEPPTVEAVFAAERTAGREPGFAAASVNFDPGRLLSRALAPAGIQVGGRP